MRKNKKYYVALISVPIAAVNDEQAYRRAAKYAASLFHPDSNVVAGHLEALDGPWDEPHVLRIRNA